MGAILCCCKKAKFEDQLTGQEKSLSNKTLIETNVPEQSIATNLVAATQSLSTENRVYVIPDLRDPEKSENPFEAYNNFDVTVETTESISSTQETAIPGSEKSFNNLFNRQTNNNLPATTESKWPSSEKLQKNLNSATRSIEHITNIEGSKRLLLNSEKPTSSLISIYKTESSKTGVSQTIDSINSSTNTKTAEMSIIKNSSLELNSQKQTSSLSSIYKTESNKTGVAKINNTSNTRSNSISTNSVMPSRNALEFRKNSNPAIYKRIANDMRTKEYKSLLLKPEEPTNSLVSIHKTKSNKTGVTQINDSINGTTSITSTGTEVPINENADLEVKSEKPTSPLISILQTESNKTEVAKTINSINSTLNTMCNSIISNTTETINTTLVFNRSLAKRLSLNLMLSKRTDGMIKNRSLMSTKRPVRFKHLTKPSDMNMFSRTFVRTSKRSFIRRGVHGNRSFRCSYHKRNYFVTLPSRKSWKEGRVVFPEDSMVCYTDGSKIAETSATGAGLYVENTGLQRSFLLESDATIFQAEIFAIKAATEENRVKDGKENSVYICCDSQPALKALCAASPKCQLVQECSKALEELANRKKVHLVWVPSHMGIPGNEKADKLAKAGPKQNYVDENFFSPSIRPLNKNIINQSIGNRTKGMYGKTSGNKRSPITNLKTNSDRTWRSERKTNKPFKRQVYNNFSIRKGTHQWKETRQNNYPLQRHAFNSSFKMKGPQPTLIFYNCQKSSFKKTYSKFMKRSKNASLC